MGTGAVLLSSTAATIVQAVDLSWRVAHINTARSAARTSEPATMQQRTPFRQPEREVVDSASLEAELPMTEFDTESIVFWGTRGTA